MNKRPEKKPILIVEDDPKTADLVSLYLGREGYATLTAAEGKTALALARSNLPLLVVLDLMLPGQDGWEVCRSLRRESDVPIIMLTARGEEEDKVWGLNLGADDYLVKPFSPRELVARVKSILRRTQAGAGRQKNIRHGGFSLDESRHLVTLHGAPVQLTPHEFKLFAALISQPGKVFNRDELLAHLYPRGEAVVEKVIDVHVGKMRQKMEPDPARPRYILTVRGVGYKLAEEKDEL